MKYTLLALCSAIGLAGCAATYQAPQGSPVAVLEDYITRIDESEGSAVICYAKAIDGMATVNAMTQTRERSTGTGKRLNVYLTDRKVVAGTRAITLRCEKLYARPVDAMLGKPVSVEGTTDVALAPGIEYEVRANLDDAEWSIYIREAKSRIAVSKSVVGAPK